MRSSLITTMALGMIACGLMAVDAPECVLTIQADRRLVDGLLAGKPLSLWRDPAARAWAGYIEHQRRLLDREWGSPPWAELLAGATAVLHRQCIAPPIHHRYEGYVSDVFGRLVTAGAATPAVHAWLESDLEPFTDDAATGMRISPGYFPNVGTRCFAYDATRFYEGHPALLPGMLGMEPTASAVPYHLRLDCRPLYAHLDEATRKEDEDLALFDRVVPTWRTWTPQMELTGDPRPEGWLGRLTVTGITGLPLRHPASLGRLARRERSLVLGLGTEPRAAMEALRFILAHTRFLTVAEGQARTLQGVDQAMTGMMGAAWARLPEVLNGDVLLQCGGNAGPLPQGSLIIGLSDGAAAAPLLEDLARRLGAIRTTDVAGADQAWNVWSPLGMINLARKGERCGAGTDAVELAAQLAGTPGDAPLDPGAAMELRVDTPALIGQIMPLACLAAMSWRMPLGTEGKDTLLSLGYQAMQAEGRKPAAAVAEQINKGLRRSGFVVGSGKDVPASQAGPSIAGYQREVTDKKKKRTRLQTAVVAHVHDGYLLITNVGKTDHCDLAGLTARLAGWTRKLGPEAAALPEIALPERPVLDQRLLPPAGPLIAHLPPWHVTVTASVEGLVGQEAGLPLATMAAAFLGELIPGWYMDNWQGVVARRLEERSRLLRVAHAEAFEVVGSLGKALSGYRGRHQWEMPPHLSTLVVESGMALADLAPLTGGTAPAEAAALDRVGRWFPANDGTLPLWGIRLDATWTLLLMRNGSLQVSDDLPDVPLLPPPPVPAINF